MTTPTQTAALQPKRRTASWRAGYEQGRLDERQDRNQRREDVLLGAPCERCAEREASESGQKQAIRGADGPIIAPVDAEAQGEVEGEP